MLYTNAVHWFVTGGQCVEAVFSLPAEFNKNMTPSDSEQRDWLNKSSHLYLYSAFNNTNCVKATAQYQNGKIVLT